MWASSGRSLVPCGSARVYRPLRAQRKGRAMFKWFEKHSGHLIKIDIDVAFPGTSYSFKRICCHCLECNEGAVFEYV